ncbi:MAG: spore coat protein CotJB [Oscillospiraceae bacterium]|nr:spore coat protein CotJB [Oscillospiraceae bacterium]
MNERKTLLARLAACDFILYETALFLDTHPDCKDALAFYQKHLEMRKKAEEEYTEKYGMLQHKDYKGQNSWQWTEGPWPWEYEEG